MAYDDSPWTDDKRDALRVEALDGSTWEEIDAYQGEEDQNHQTGEQ
jgi:hypothetical protein